MAKGVSDISNTVVRIFLQEIGKAYDQQRGFDPYMKKNLSVVREHFGDACCYCGAPGARHRLTGDHLIPMNKASLGLEAWGNVVPACHKCNDAKHSKNWETFLPDVAGDAVDSRAATIRSFVDLYAYAPNLEAIRLAVDELYEESGAIAMQLVNLKLKRALGALTLFVD